MRKIFLGLMFLLSLTIFANAETKQNFVSALPSDINLSNSINTWIDLPVASTMTFRKQSISTATLASATTSYTLANADYTDILFPRNVVCVLEFDSGNSTTTASASLSIAGVDQFGRSKSETLTISTNSATGSVAWSSITSFEVSGFTCSTGTLSENLSIFFGTGVKIGLGNNVQESGNIIKVLEAGAVSTTYVLSTTYDTISFAAAPDGSKDYYMYFQNRTNKTVYEY